MQDKKQLSINPAAAGLWYLALRLPPPPPCILLLFPLSLQMHFSVGVPRSHLRPATSMAVAEASKERLRASRAH